MKKLLLIIGLILSSSISLCCEKDNKADLDSYYRVKKLIPDHPLVSPMHVALPPNYICTSASTLKGMEDFEGYFWAPKGVMEEAIKSMGKDENGQERYSINPKEPALLVEISSNVIQTGKDAFSIEDVVYNDPSISAEKLWWGKYPVLYVISRQGNVDLYSAFMGLNCGSEVLSITLFPPSMNSREDTKKVNQFWAKFLAQTAALDSMQKPVGEEENLPFELAVLQLPEGTKKNWKPINKAISHQKSITESIPVDQELEDWTDLLSALYIYGVKTDHPDTLDLFIHNTEKATLSSYPGCKLDWRIVEKDKQGFICETVLHEPYYDVPPEYEVSRFIFSNNGIHRISYTKRKEKISSQEKKEWLERLKNDMSIVGKNELKEVSDGFALSM